MNNTRTRDGRRRRKRENIRERKRKIYYDEWKVIKKKKIKSGRSRKRIRRKLL
jgi:hypothetical protein